MKLIQPFRGWRPQTEWVAQVSAPPYDVLNRQEASLLARDNPYSFLHVSKAEIDLPQEMDPHDPLVYQAARKRLDGMRQSGILFQDSTPSLYFYRLVMGFHQQLGLVSVASVPAYLEGRIKKHEFTRPDKEEDRTRLAVSLSAHSGPVFLTHRPSVRLERITQEALASSRLLYDFHSSDGVGHTFWRVEDPRLMVELVEAVEELSALYIADGHHRSAAAVRISLERRRSHSLPEEALCNRFLNVLFPSNQMRILDYNRVVRDLNGATVEAFLDSLSGRFQVTPADGPVRPDRKHVFGMYLAGRGWYRLDLSHSPEVDPLVPGEHLDVTLLSRYLLEPILNIHDPRRDPRIDFVGGIRGMEGLMARVNSGEMAVAFSLFPTGMEELMRVADAGEVMPPKSTWFEPKLRDGLVIQEI